MLLPLLLAAACADPDAVPPVDPGDDTYHPDDVVLRVEHVGGLLMPETAITMLPVFTLYGDGRVVTEGAQIAIYPGPALPAISVRTVSPSVIADLVRLAVDAGVGQTGDLGSPPVADASTTRITVVVSGGVRESHAYALGLHDGLSRDQVAARRKLSDLVDKLTDLPGTVGEENAGDETLYEPTAMAVLARSYVDSDDGPTQEEKAWPGPALPGPQLGDPGFGLHCLTVTGAELAPALEAAAWPANQRTPWVWEGQRYQLTFRPLLPDESSCSDLGS